MDSAPAQSIETVCGFLRFTADAPAMQNINGRFGEIARSVYKDNFSVYFHIAYHEDTDTVEYRLLRDSLTNEGRVELYEYTPSDYRFIKAFFIKIHRGAPHPSLKWTPIKQNDSAFLQWLNFSFYYTVLVVEEDVNFDCSSILALIPENYTFNWIISRCKPCKAIERIIQKSKDADRLKVLNSVFL